MAQTANVSLVCDRKGKVISRQRYGEGLGIIVGGAEGNEEVEDAWLKGQEDVVNCTAKCVIRGDEELPGSRFLRSA